jgi:hypothetical protein
VLDEQYILLYNDLCSVVYPCLKCVLLYMDEQCGFKFRTKSVKLNDLHLGAELFHPVALPSRSPMPIVVVPHHYPHPEVRP